MEGRVEEESFQRSSYTSTNNQTHNNWSTKKYPKNTAIRTYTKN